MNFKRSTYIIWHIYLQSNFIQTNYGHEDLICNATEDDCRRCLQKFGSVEIDYGPRPNIPERFYTQILALKST